MRAWAGNMQRIESGKRFRRRMVRAAQLAVTGQWRQLLYSSWVIMHGLDFAMVGLEELGLSSGQSECYCPSGGPDLERVFRTLEIKPTDRIIDVGCGKGASLITLAKFPFAKIAGVEISPELIRVAEANFARLRLRGIELHCCDATLFRDYDEYSFVYLFNPFKAPVMTPVIENLAASLKRRPRRLTIVYLYPICRDVLVSAGFEKLREFNYGPLPIVVYVNKGTN